MIKRTLNRIIHKYSFINKIYIKIIYNRKQTIPQKFYLSTVSMGITLQPRRPLPAQGRGVKVNDKVLDPRLMFTLIVLYLLFCTKVPISFNDLKFR